MSGRFDSIDGSVAQTAERGVAVGLFEGFAADSLGLADVDARIGRGVVSRRPADGRLVAVKDNEHERSGPSAVSGLPR